MGNGQVQQVPSCFVGSIMPRMHMKRTCRLGLEESFMYGGLLKYHSNKDSVWTAWEAAGRDGSQLQPSSYQVGQLNFSTWFVKECII